MARPPLAPPDECYTLNIYLKREQAKKLRELSNKWNISQSEVVRRLLDNEPQP